jgi:hypothetical protein
MRSKPMVALAVVLCLLSVPGPALSHHGISMFDMTKTVTFKGTVTDFEWTNPHSYVYVEGKDDKGNVEKWIAEGGSPLMLSRYGWSRGSVKKGDQVTIIGHPFKDGRKTMRLEKIVLPDGTELPGNALVG